MIAIQTSVPLQLNNRLPIMDIQMARGGCAESFRKKVPSICRVPNKAFDKPMPTLQEGWTIRDAEALIISADEETVGRAIIFVAMDPPNRIWAERVCVRMAAHHSPYIRGNAILGFGHLARIFRYLNQATVKPIIEAGLIDADLQVRSKAADAADDIEWFLGWVFKGREENRQKPMCPK